MEHQLVGIFNSEVEAAQAYDARVRALGLHEQGRSLNFIDASTQQGDDGSENNLTDAAKLLYRVVTREREDSLLRIAELPSETTDGAAAGGGHAEEKKEQEDGDEEEKAGKVAVPARRVVDEKEVDGNSLDSQDSDSDLAQSDGKKTPYSPCPSPAPFLSIY